MILTEEKHGGGPKHYSFTNGGLLIELYPRGERAVSNVRLGLFTNDESLVNGDAIIDPDGNRIELLLAATLNSRT